MLNLKSVCLIFLMTINFFVHAGDSSPDPTIIYTGDYIGEQTETLCSCAGCVTKTKSGKVISTKRTNSRIEPEVKINSSKVPVPKVSNYDLSD